jgi:hypothetical protein
MRKRTLILLAMAALLTLAAVRGVRAFPSQEIIYTVRYSCIISPSAWGEIEGQWVTDCSGYTTGWGWEPGHNCTTTDITYGNTCPTGGGGDPGGPENRN